MRGRTPLLALRQVSRYFGAVEALVDVDLEVHAHEVVALVGDNGAGKSTLAQIVAGVLTPSSGQVEIDGEPVSISSPSAANQLGVASVFQDLAVCENLDVTANVFLGQELRGRGGLLRDGAMVAGYLEAPDTVHARLTRAVEAVLSEE